jgi:hypothetical protein
VVRGGYRWVVTTAQFLRIGGLEPGGSLFQSLFSKGSGEVVFTVITWGEQSSPHEMITPTLGCSLIITGNCPDLGVDLSCKALLLLRGSLVPCHKDVTVLPWFLESRENGSEQNLTSTKRRQGCQHFLLFLVNCGPMQGVSVYQNLSTF